ncbi:MAG: hypothetical protein IKG42_03485 [Clostridia bacterium]|nr:hypothetical protein [Clostridia bacterium]
MKFLKITNNEKKEWLIPLEKMKMALCLYQPSSCKGKTLKAFLPFVLKIPVLRNIILKIFDFQIVDYQLDNNLLECISKNLKIQSFKYSIFKGTPGKHQKTTIQIYDNNNILAYCKISEDINVFELFRHEEKVLKYLEKCKIYNVPRCLYCGIVGNYYVFIQSTEKTLKSFSSNKLDSNKIQFIRNMCNKTSKEMCGDKSEYYYMLQSFQNDIEVLKNYDILKEYVSFLKDLILRIEERVENINIFCVYHGDFTPWNIFEENGKIFLFDFEYASFEYPAYLDIFHFFTQDCIYSKRYEYDEIYTRYLSFLKPILMSEKLFSNIDEAYIMYLLSVCQLYINREKNNMDDEIQRHIKIRLDLMKEIDKNYKI